ncbi:MAG TPA: DUF1127 domain-containing protein [Ferrovibrio sp.]|uniref:DUF1127 domain-containing protein n=1 Tax=Ferrovibrio sp. TaxID=1917215 RepID=UPI002ED031DD
MAQARIAYRFFPDYQPKALARLLAARIGGLLAWQRRARERGQLAELSDIYLKDMGLSRADALREASRPFWRG